MAFLGEGCHFVRLYSNPLNLWYWGIKTFVFLEVRSLRAKLGWFLLRTLFGLFSHLSVPGLSS